MVRSTLILAVAAAALGASCFPPEAGAQESIDRLAVMDQRVQQQSSGATAAAAGAGRTANQTAGGTAGEVQGAQAAIEDEAERPFTVSVDLPVSYTNNAFQSEDDEEDDLFFAPALSLGYQLSLEGLGDPSGVISFGASISTERYADSSDLDTDFLAGSVQYVHAFGAFLTSLSYSPSRAYEPDFDDASVTIHPVSASVSRDIEPGQNLPVLTPSLTFRRTWADPSELNQSRTAIALAIAHPVSQQVSLSLTPSLSGALYDDWFEDELGEDRRDLELGLEALLTWTLAPNHVTLTGGVTFTRNYSTLPDNEFSRFDVTPTLGLTLTF